MAGHIDATVEGRPLTIEGIDGRLRITIPSLSTALFLRSRTASLIRTVDAITRRTGLAITAKAPLIPEIRLSPDRGLFAGTLIGRG